MNVIKNKFQFLTLCFLLLSQVTYADRVGDQNFEMNFSPEEIESLTWTIKHETWTEEHEKAYEKFIYEIGQALIKKSCRRVNQCLYTVGKKLYPLRTPKRLPLASYNKNGPKQGHDDDCSKGPFFTRAFFAWVHHLPFAWPKGYKIKEPNKNREIRMSDNGTEVLGWDYVISGEETINSVLNKLTNVFSVYYRVSAKEDVRVNGEFGDENYFAHPFYAIDITKESMTPGTVLYSANFGHITTIREVTEEGEIKLIGSHPGFYTSTPRFGKQLFKSKSTDTKLGNGFFKWRNVTLVDYTEDENGVLQGGTYKADVEKQNESFGLTQFDIIKKKEEDKNFSYFEYVQNVVGDLNAEINLLERFKLRMDELCESIIARHSTVEEAFANGINRKAHPAKLPPNIYATSVHEWELYSTPSRDMAFKGNIIANLDYMKRLVKRYKNKDHRIIYTGSSLKQDLDKLYKEESQCTMTYVNSVGKSVEVTLHQAIERLFKLSFDPYHCMELRWGAEGDELKTCKDNKTKRDWYTEQQRLRNVYTGGHEIEISMNLTLAELKKENKKGSKALGNDTVDPLIYSFQTYIQSLED